MDLMDAVLVVVGAVLAWVVLAGVIALLAGRMIHERDVHDRPAQSAARRVRLAVQHR